jgi:hypothetical protein
MTRRKINYASSHNPILYCADRDGSSCPHKGTQIDTDGTATHSIKTHRISASPDAEFFSCNASWPYSNTIHSNTRKEVIAPGTTWL